MPTGVIFLASDGSIWCWIISAVVLFGIFSSKNEDKGSGSTGSPSSPRPRTGGGGGGGGGAYMGSFEVRAKEVMRGRDNNLRAIAIEARGLIPVPRTSSINFVAVGTDVTDDSSGDPIICVIESFQWPDNVFFRSFKAGGTISPNQGFGEWVEIGVAPTDTLVTPKSGKRNLKFTGMVVRGGSEQSKVRELDIIAMADATIRTDIKEVGYKERDERRIEAIKLSVRLGIAVAYADGSIATAEGKVIRDWALKQLEQIPEDDREAAKNTVNEAIRYAGQRAKAGQLNHESVAAELRGSPLQGIKLQALELCVKVMSADGVASSQEMALIRRLGDILGVSHDDLRKLIDKNPPSARSKGATGELSDEEMVGMPQGLSKEDCLREIRKLFATYNGRLTNEKDPDKRAHYQRMLEALARLRLKYGS